jgi:thiamine-monophosphate kinase
VPVTSEAAFIAALRAIATAPAARGLMDDAAVLDVGAAQLVLTMDAIVEGVHFLPDDPPDSVAWKLVATNVSDLSAKGARPRGCLLSYPLNADESWNAGFLRGLEDACAAFAIPLLGGDTVRQPNGSPRSLSLVAVGESGPGIAVPSRAGARAGDIIWVTGPIGDAGLGLSLLKNELSATPQNHDALVSRYRRPAPQPMLGQALAAHVTAMMDVSDGLLIDVSRLAAASEIAAIIELDRVPLSRSFIETCGDGLDERRRAASAGDDYCLLLTGAPEAEALMQAAALKAGGRIYQVGRIMSGRGLGLLHGGEPVPLPQRLGFEH